MSIKQSAFLSKTSDRASDNSLPRVSHTVENNNTKNSVCIQGIKKRELVDMYREDFQNILRKQRSLLFVLRSFIQPCMQGHRSRTKDHYGKFGDIFQESIKQKIQSVQ